MADFSVGQSVRLSLETRDLAGVLTDATAVTLTVKLPDATTTAVTTSHDGVGLYSATYTTTQAGLHALRWVTTGAVAIVEEDTFDVDPAFGRGGIVGLDDVKRHLNIDTADSDDELQGFIDATTPVIEGIIGPVVPRLVSETHEWAPRFVLWQRPVISLQSVSLVYPTTGTAYAVSSGFYIFDQDTASIAFLTPQPWPLISRASVTYTAGRATVPGNVRMAALELIRVNWEPQRGPRPAAFGHPDDFAIRGESAAAGLGFFLPNRVRELLAPSRDWPAVA